MKMSLLIGGILGFVCGFAFSDALHRTWFASLGRGSLSAALAGLVLTWWGMAWSNSLKTAELHHQAKEALLTTSTQSNTLLS